MNYSCPKCHKIIAKEDRRKRHQQSLVALHPAKLEIRVNEAPAVRCGFCNSRVILLKGGGL